MQEKKTQKIMYLTFLFALMSSLKHFVLVFPAKFLKNLFSLQTFANIIFLNRINKFHFADILRLRAESKGKKKKRVIEINVVLL